VILTPEFRPSVVPFEVTGDSINTNQSSTPSTCQWYDPPESMNADSPQIDYREKSSRLENKVPVRVALVEDQQRLRDDISELVTLDRSFELVAVASNGTDAIERFPKSRAEVVLMDISLPGMDGVQCVHRLRPLMPRTQFMMLTVFEDTDIIITALEAGATGYLVKSASWERIREAMLELHRGGSPMSSSIARKLINHFVAPRRLSESVEDGPQNSELTLREMEILSAIAGGGRYKEIAKTLNISPHTVRAHVHSVYRKLQVHSRTQAIDEFLRIGGSRIPRFLSHLETDGR